MISGLLEHDISSSDKISGEYFCITSLSDSNLTLLFFIILILNS
ncbi:hypothetical protein FTE_0428 [Francisella tularensis subsp. novicida FTE]|nr:hypothetical protein FTE_0428 [Francisella tularensis subsp. novicida FTE]